MRNRGGDNDICLAHLAMLATPLFALCMFALELKVEFANPDLNVRELIACIFDNATAFTNFCGAFLFLFMCWMLPDSYYALTRSPPCADHHGGSR